MTEMRDNPAGWYRDPDHPKWHRYWDGTAWQEPLEELLRAQAVRPDPDAGSS